MYRVGDFKESDWETSTSSSTVMFDDARKPIFKILCYGDGSADKVDRKFINMILELKESPEARKIMEKYGTFE